MRGCAENTNMNLLMCQIHFKR